MRVCVYNYCMLQFIYMSCASKDENKNTQFTILTDRSHGGSSLTDGNLEIMVLLLFQCNYT